MDHIRNFILPFLLLLSVSCSIFVPDMGPPPGWELDASELLIENELLSSGWQLDDEQELSRLPDANHVARIFYNPNLSGIVSQDVFRAYTIDDAEEKYDELLENQFGHSTRSLTFDEIFVPFESPEEINFQSNLADRFYFACGWWTFAYCQLIAQYRNYVVYLRLDHEAEYQGYQSEGLTYEEMDEIIKGTDDKFNAFFLQISN